jgi:hypothetical protein
MKMRKVFGLLIVVLLAFLFIFAASSKVQNVKEVKAVEPGIKPQSLTSSPALKPDVDFGKIPLYFISNKGQVNEKAKFYAKASRYTLWMTKGGLVFDSSRKVGVEKTHPAPAGHPSQEGNFVVQDEDKGFLLCRNPPDCLISRNSGLFLLERFVLSYTGLLPYLHIVHLDRKT